MGKFIIITELRKLEMDVNKGRISYSRMVEILNEKAEQWFNDRLNSELVINHEIPKPPPDRVIREGVLPVKPKHIK